MTTTLEKVKHLEKYIASNNSTVDPVIDMAIDKIMVRESKNMLDLKSRLIEQLRKYEKKYSLDSNNFYNRYENGEMGDKTDFIEWASTVEMLENTERRIALLEKKPDS